MIMMDTHAISNSFIPISYCPPHINNAAITIAKHINTSTLRYVISILILGNTYPRLSTRISFLYCFPAYTSAPTSIANKHTHSHITNPNSCKKVIKQQNDTYDINSFQYISTNGKLFQTFVTCDEFFHLSSCNNGLTNVAIATTTAPIATK